MVSIPLVPSSRQLNLSDPDWDLSLVAAAMEDDKIVLISSVTPERADTIVSDVAEYFGIGEKLKLQAAFAAVAGHRENVGRSFMTVNRRKEYEFITAHSEGTHSTGMQLASFYCVENSTDGGYTILYNIDENGIGWSKLFSAKIKIDLCGMPLSRSELINARVSFGLFLPEDTLKSDDIILEELTSPFLRRRIYKVLSPLVASFCRILGRAVYGYWDSVGSVDHSARDEFVEFLREMGLLRLPPNGADPVILDHSRYRRVWQSNVPSSELFKAMIVRKLQPGELLLQNNLTWAHAVSNWTPGSGTRRVIAAFA